MSLKCPLPRQVASYCRPFVLLLDIYIHRAAQWRKADQLFICFGPPKKGIPADQANHKSVGGETITLAYESSGLPLPMGVRAHSTRGMAASKALSVGVALQDVCAAAGWSSPHTFIRFYSLDLTSTRGP